MKKINEIIKKKNEKNYAIVELEYNHYYGSGKCWIAEVDSETKKILRFIDAESKQPRDRYSGIKTYKLQEGKSYAANEKGTKSRDSRYYWHIVNGELE